MFVGDVLEALSGVLVVFGVFVALWTMVGTILAVGCALIVLAMFVFYLAQAYSTVSIKRSAPDRVDRTEAPKTWDVNWLPEETDWDGFKTALAKQLGQSAVTMITAKNWLDRLRADGVVTTDDNIIRRA